jgi:hypothetical protein
MSAAQVLDRLETEDRFVKADVLDMAFTTPVVASFDLDSLDMGSASALTPNGRPDQPE